MITSSRTLIRQLSALFLGWDFLVNVETSSGAACQRDKKGRIALLVAVVSADLADLVGPPPSKGGNHSGCVREMDNLIFGDL